MKRSWTLLLLGTAGVLYSAEVLFYLFTTLAALRENEGFAVLAFGREFTPQSYAAVHIVLLLLGAGLLVLGLRTRNRKAAELRTK